MFSYETKKRLDLSAVVLFNMLKGNHYCYNGLKCKYEQFVCSIKRLFMHSYNFDEILIITTFNIIKYFEKLIFII